MTLDVDLSRFQPQQRVYSEPVVWIVLTHEEMFPSRPRHHPTPSRRTGAVFDDPCSATD